MAHAAEHENPLYGVMAEFDSVQAIVDASKHAVSAGYSVMEAYSPIPDRGTERHHPQEADQAARAWSSSAA